MFVTIITDCKGENEKGRQETRFLSLGLGPVSFVGIDSSLGINATIEAAGNLVDILDAGSGKKGVVVVNVAPRGERNIDGPNGSDFCFFNFKKTLVISTIKNYNLSLVKKLNLAENVKIMNIEKVLNFATKNNLINDNHQAYISRSQFRSFDFVPRVAQWLTNNIDIPYTNFNLTKIPEISSCIWCIDAFGNCKSTALESDLNTGKGLVKTRFGNFKFYQRLKDVPKKETGLYVGSSGIRDKRFIEIATQGVYGSASRKLGLKIGMPLF